MTNEQLFKQAFADSDNFIDFYFNKRRNKVQIFDNLNTNNNINSNELIAQIGVLNTTLVNNDKKYKCAFLTGICVKETHQNQGVMKQFLVQILQLLKENKYDLALLSPKNDQYYLKYNFTPALIGDWVKCIYKENPNITTRQASKNDTDLMLKLYKQNSKNFDVYQKLDKNDINDIIDEYNLEDDTILIVYNNSKPIGWIAMENDKIEHMILPNATFLDNIKQVHNKSYFKCNLNGSKQLFQALSLCSPLPDFLNCKFLFINKY